MRYDPNHPEENRVLWTGVTLKEERLSAWIAGFLTGAVSMVLAVVCYSVWVNW